MSELATNARLPRKKWRITIVYRKHYNHHWSGYDNSAFPKFKIVCETENHIGYINLKPKPEHQNNGGYSEIDAELFRITGNRISYIQIIQASGLTSYLYRRPDNLQVKSDAGWNTTVTLHANNSRAIYLFTNEFRSSASTKDILGGFAIRYFMDASDRPLFINGQEIESGPDAGRKLLKQAHHKRYNTPHKESIGSPIEKLFRDELIRNGIQFEEQVEIILENKKFSVPDFVIGSAGLMIYCDGTEFHKDPQRIIMDKQQDRVLQTQGFNVFRFSGSEIAADVKKCVREVLAFISKKNASTT